MGIYCKSAIFDTPTRFSFYIFKNVPECEMHSQMDWLSLPLSLPVPTFTKQYVVGSVLLELKQKEREKHTHTHVIYHSILV